MAAGVLQRHLVVRSSILLRPLSHFCSCNVVKTSANSAKGPLWSFSLRQRCQFLFYNYSCTKLLLLLMWPVTAQTQRTKIPPHEVEWLRKQHDIVASAVTLRSVRQLCDDSAVACYLEKKCPQLTRDAQLLRVRGLLSKYCTKPD